MKMSSIGLLLMVVVTIIVGVALFVESAHNASGVTEPAASNITQIVIVMFALAIAFVGLVFFSESARDWAKELFK